MIEHDSSKLFVSKNPLDSCERINAIRVEHGYPIQQVVGVTNGKRKNPILSRMGVQTLHSEVDIRKLYNVGDSELRVPDQWLNADEMKEVGEKGEQWWNKITGTAEHGLYYPLGYEPFSYTSGAAMAKLVFIDDYLKAKGNEDLFGHYLVAVDWHSSHGHRRSQKVENKPLDQIDALSNRLRLAQEQSEFFYSSFAMAIRRPDGKMSVVETLVKCGILNPDMPFETIQEYVTPNRYTLPAGMDLYDAMNDSIIVNDDSDGLHGAMQRWYYAGGAPAEIWRKVILPRRYDIAARAQVYVPGYEKLVTSERYKRIDLGDMDADRVKEIFFGNID